MTFDFKITTWEKITVATEHEVEILENIKNGTITSSTDILDYLAENDLNDNVDTEIMLEVSEQMSIEENDGNCTIEVMDDNGESIWTNV